MNYYRHDRHDHRGPKPATRPLPSGMPEYIAVELIESEHRGARQWIARYPLYENGRESDFIDIVANIPSRTWFEPEHGERWWVKPTAMAPYRRLVFAELYARVGVHYAPLTVRTDDELFLTFAWSKSTRDHRTTYDGWTVALPGNHHHICRDELWQVRVRRIDPPSGLIEVSSVGPHPKTYYTPPKQVGYLSVSPIFRDCDLLEGDVFGYWQHSWATAAGQLTAKIEHKGRVVRLECSQLRKLPAGVNKYGKPAHKIVGVVSQNDASGYLAELVLIEGEAADRPNLPDDGDHREVQRNAPRRGLLLPLRYLPDRASDVPEEEDDGIHELIAEELENSEPPDRGDYGDYDYNDE